MYVGREDRVERRLRKCLALAALCRAAKFDKVSGKRLEEFLGILISALDDEVNGGEEGIRTLDTGLPRITV